MAHTVLPSEGMITSMRSLVIREKRTGNDLGQMAGLASRSLLDLLPAAEAVGEDQRIGRGLPYARQQPDAKTSESRPRRASTARSAVSVITAWWWQWICTNAFPPMCGNSKSR